VQPHIYESFSRFGIESGCGTFIPGRDELERITRFFQWRFRRFSSPAAAFLTPVTNVSVRACESEYNQLIFQGGFFHPLLRADWFFQIYHEKYLPVVSAMQDRRAFCHFGEVVTGLVQRRRFNIRPAGD
jgi:hypothetical protein